MAANKNQSAVRVGLVTLGCAKNLVDAEIMLGHLLRDGVELTSDPAQADVVIINTCSFIEAAQEESVDTILRSSELREAHHRRQGLIVSGCLPQRFRDDLPKLLPEVDVFMGIDQVAQAPQLVREAMAKRAARLDATRPAAQRSRARARSRSKSQVVSRLAEVEPSNSAANDPVLRVDRRPTYIPDYATPRFRLTPAHTAYLKIAEGCNHPCSFCIIPRMRGQHRSRPLNDLVEEARRMVAEGVRELNLISQDSTYYGLDLRPEHRPNIASPKRFQEAAGALPSGAATLPALLRALNGIPGEFWIRILYTHPAHWTDALIEAMAECGKVARYVDIPLQHIHPIMLERMRRETTREHIEDLLRRIRRGVPGITLRTTFIVGFPGETEACFQSLLEFIESFRFERLGVFTYSREDGTLAGRMRGQVPDRVKRARRDRAMAMQHGIATELSRARVGQTCRVLVEQEASAKELQMAKIHSWEHGFLREGDAGLGKLRGQFWVARSEADAPDIDGRVYVRGLLPVGRFVNVRILGHTDYDLVAELAG